MIFKKVIQILIILLIILISYLVLNIYFFDKKEISDLDLNKNSVIESDPATTVGEDNLNIDNVMENLEYKSSDKSGNNYIIKAKKGKVDLEKENLLILEDVYGEIETQFFTN